MGRLHSDRQMDKEPCPSPMVEVQRVVPVQIGCVAPSPVLRNQIRVQNRFELLGNIVEGEQQGKLYQQSIPECAGDSSDGLVLFAEENLEKLASLKPTSDATGKVVSMTKPVSAMRKEVTRLEPRPPASVNGVRRPDLGMNRHKTAVTSVNSAEKPNPLRLIVNKDVVTVFLPPGFISDHSVSVVDVKVLPTRLNRPFKFLNHWTTADSFMSTVRNIWDSSIRGHISVIMDKDGRMLHSPTHIADEFILFYKKLLGSSAAVRGFDEALPIDLIWRKRVIRCKIVRESWMEDNGLSNVMDLIKRQRWEKLFKRRELVHVDVVKEFYARMTLTHLKKKDVVKTSVRGVVIEFDHLKLASIHGIPGNNGICEYIKDVWEESKYTKPLEIT
ncbi:hypothetical protein Dimus_019914 [Dionaea muscipula]